MKSKIIVILAMLFTACANPTDINADFLISDKGIGLFKNHISLAEVQELVPEKQLKRIMEYGEFQDEKLPAYQYFDKNNTLLLEFLLVDDVDSVSSKIERIVIVSPLYKTKAGWGVGSTFEEVKKSTKIIYSEPDMEVIHIYTEKPKLGLIIGKKDLENGWWNEKTKSIDIDKIPNSTKITRIYKTMK